MGVEIQSSASISIVNASRPLMKRGDKIAGTSKRASSPQHAIHESPSMTRQLDRWRVTHHWCEDQHSHRTGQDPTRRSPSDAQFPTSCVLADVALFRIGATLLRPTLALRRPRNVGTWRGRKYGGISHRRGRGETFELDRASLSLKVSSSSSLLPLGFNPEAIIMR